MTLFICEGLCRSLMAIAFTISTVSQPPTHTSSMGMGWFQIEIFTANSLSLAVFFLWERKSHSVVLLRKTLNNSVFDIADCSSWPGRISARHCRRIRGLTGIWYTSICIKNKDKGITETVWELRLPCGFSRRTVQQNAGTTVRQDISSNDVAATTKDWPVSSKYTGQERVIRTRLIRSST